MRGANGNHASSRGHHQQAQLQQQQQQQKFGIDSHSVPVYTTQANQRSYRSQTPLLHPSSTTEHFYGNTQPKHVLHQVIRQCDSSNRDGDRDQSSEFKLQETNHQSERARCQSGPRNIHSSHQSQPETNTVSQQRSRRKASYEDHRRWSPKSKGEQDATTINRRKSLHEKMGNGLAAPSSSELPLQQPLQHHRREDSRQSAVRQNFIKESTQAADNSSDYMQKQQKHQQSQYSGLSTEKTSIHKGGINHDNPRDSRNNQLVQRAESALGGTSQLSRTSTGIELNCHRPITTSTQRSISNEMKVQNSYNAPHADRTYPDSSNIQTHNSCLNLTTADLSGTSSSLFNPAQNARISQTTNQSRVNLLQKQTIVGGGSEAIYSEHHHHHQAQQQLQQPQHRMTYHQLGLKENIAPPSHGQHINLVVPQRHQQHQNQYKYIGQQQPQQPGQPSCKESSKQRKISGGDVFSFTRNSIQPIPSYQHLSIQHGQPTPQSPNFPVLKSPGVIAFSQQHSLDCEGNKMKIPIEIVNSAFSFQKNGQAQSNNYHHLVHPDFNSTKDSSVLGNDQAGKDGSRLSKLLNVFEAATLDLKTYSVTVIDSFEQVSELQKSLGIISSYIDLARREVLDHVCLLQADSANTLLSLKRANERKVHYKNKYKQNSLHQTQSLAHQSQHTQNSHRSRKKIRLNSTGNTSQHSHLNNSNPSELLQQHPLTMNTTTQADLGTTATTQEQKQMSQSRHQLIEEVKDLTAKNALILDKFKEFTKQEEPLRQAAAIALDSHTVAVQQAYKNPNVTNPPQKVSRLPISRCDEKQNKKDSIHQDSESDRFCISRKQCKIRKQSLTGGAGSNNIMGKRKLSSTMMNISKGGTRVFNGVNSSPIQNTLLENQITSPDQVTSFNGETQQMMPNVILTQEEEYDNDNDYGKNLLTEEGALQSEQSQDVESRHQMRIFGSSTQRFDEDILTGAEEEEAAQVAHFSRTTFTKNQETRAKHSKGNGGHKRQASSDYQGDYSTNIDYSCSMRNGNMDQISSSQGNKHQRVSSKRHQESCSAGGGHKKVTSSAAQHKCYQTTGKQVVATSKMISSSSGQQRQRGKSSILMKQLAQNVLMSDIEQVEISSQSTTQMAGSSCNASSFKKTHLKTKSGCGRRPQSRLK